MSATDLRASPGELPHHPDRGFAGADQVLRNWTAIFATVPDLAATILRTATSGAEVWSEWEMRGTDTAGAHVTLVGRVVLTTRDGRIAWTQFYRDRSAQRPAENCGADGYRAPYHDLEEHGHVRQVLFRIRYPRRVIHRPQPTPTITPIPFSRSPGSPRRGSPGSQCCSLQKRPARASENHARTRSAIVLDRRLDGG